MNKVIKIGSIKIREDLYPRNKWDWTCKARYYKAMESGSIFPPIVVAKKGFSFILVDGLHRLLANKDRKQTHITAEILTKLTDAEIYAEAVKRNSAHGRQFSTYETATIITKLEDFGYNTAKISELVGIPTDDLKPFVAKRMTLATETSEAQILKSPLKNLSGTEVGEINQNIFHSHSQIAILESLISLIENGFIDTNSEVILRKLAKLYILLNELA